jgi:hypothetical protein
MDGTDQDPGDQPLGPNAPSLLATEHWGLIAERSLVWNEAQSRATMFLTVLSAAGVAVALVANDSVSVVAALLGGCAGTVGVGDRV